MKVTNLFFLTSWHWLGIFPLIGPNSNHAYFTPEEKRNEKKKLFFKKGKAFISQNRVFGKESSYLSRAIT